MKIVCSVQVGNRQLSTLGSNKPVKSAKSTLALCKHPKSDEYFIMLFTSQNKNGTKYNIKNNIKQVLTRFINEGKCTIQFSQPEHDLFVQGDVVQLKCFLQCLKRILENKFNPKEFSISSMSVTAVKNKDIAPTKLIIKNRSEYPSKGFPRTLEELRINEISKMSIEFGITFLVRLQVLDLSNNSIESIPDYLSRLSNLKELNLSHNNLGMSKQRTWKWVEEKISKSLLTLDLSHNNLEILPNQLCKLFNLSTLNVNHNSLQTLPYGIGNLRNLKVLNVSNNAITSFPETIKMFKLQFFDISHNNFISNPPRPSSDNTKHGFKTVCSLKEYSARIVLKTRQPYAPGSLPITLIKYLDDARYCVCGKACLENYEEGMQILFVYDISESINTTANERRHLPVNCTYCSVKCRNSAFQNRQRNPIVR